MNDKSYKRKELLYKLVKSGGYHSMREFSIDVGINEANIYSNLRGSWGMSIKRMFKIANLLKCPIEDIIAIFYPEEFSENRLYSESN